MRALVYLLLFSAISAHANCTREFKTMEREVNADRVWVARVFAEAGCPLLVLPRAERMLDRFWSLKTGQIDFVSAATPLPERLEFAWFSVPYGKERIVMVTHQALAAQIHVKSMPDLLSLQRPVIGPHFGYYGEAWPETKKQLQAAGKFTAYNNWAKARGMLLRQPDSILVIVEDAARDVVAHERPPLVILPESLSESELVFMFGKKTVTEAEVAVINAAIERLLARGIKPGDG